MEICENKFYLSIMTSIACLEFNKDPWNSLIKHQAVLNFLWLPNTHIIKLQISSSIDPHFSPHLKARNDDFQSSLNTQIAEYTKFGSAWTSNSPNAAIASTSEGKRAARLSNSTNWALRASFGRWFWNLTVSKWNGWATFWEQNGSAENWRADWEGRWSVWWNAWKGESGIWKLMSWRSWRNGNGEFLESPLAIEERHAMNSCTRLWDTEGSAGRWNLGYNLNYETLLYGRKWRYRAPRNRQVTVCDRLVYNSEQILNHEAIYLFFFFF